MAGPEKSSKPSTEPGKRPAPPADSSRRRLLTRTTLPYFVAVVFACAAMGWYCFSYVPAQIEYFVGLRFRTLAVVAGQVKSKAENLDKSAFRAIEAVAQDKRAAYLSALIPEFRFQLTPAASASVVGFALPQSKKVVAWEELIRPAVGVSLRDFDDLALADKDGRVVWQREQSTPRLGNLKELIHATSEATGWLSFSWQIRTTNPNLGEKLTLPTAAVLKPLNLDGASRYLLVQSVSVASPNRAETKPEGAPATSQPGPGPSDLFVAGLVSRHALERQAVRIPALWVAFLALPVVLLLLALPFVKLATLTPKERYTTTDSLLMIVASICAVGIGALLVFDDGDRDSILTTFADKIEANLAAESARVLELAQTLDRQRPDIEAQLRACKTTPTDEFFKKPCGLWQALQRATTFQAGGLELDIVAWLDNEGDQVEKWTTKSELTGKTPHNPYAHFKDVSTDRVWRRKNDRGDVLEPAFTMEPLRTPTTAAMGFVFALRSQHPGAKFMALNVRPQSVVDPVVPPGYGFAVLAGDGRVLFHSEEALSLQEDFFAEVSAPDAVRARARSDQKSTWNGDYHGRPHRLHMQGMSTYFDGCPWKVVTFQEREPVLDARLRQHGSVARLGTLNLLLLAGTVAGLACVVVAYFGRGVRDLVWCVPPMSRWALRVLGAAAAAAVFLLGLTFRPGAWNWLDFYTAVFVLLPLLTVVLVIVDRLSTPAAARLCTRRQSTREVALLVLLVAAIPAAGFSRIATMVHGRSDADQWLEESARRWHERHQNVLSRMWAQGYDPDTIALLRHDGAFASAWPTPEGPARSGATEQIFSYLSVIGGITTTPQTPGSTPAQGAASGSVPVVERLLNLAPTGARDVPRRPTTRTTQDGLLQVLRPGEPEVPALAIAFAPRLDFSPAGIAGFIAIFVATCSALGWARRKLSMPRYIQPPGLTAQLARVTNGAEAVFVIGPPRGKKDQSVIDAVRVLTGDEPAKRVRLLDVKLDRAFIDRTLGEIRELTKGGAGVHHARTLWIQVSNLEAQLATHRSRTRVLQLLEQLLQHGPGEPARVVVVTTTIDPIANFEEIFNTERKRIYKDAIPEVELGRSSLLLSRVHRCYSPIRNERAEERWRRWLNYSPTRWRETLAAEVAGYEPLESIAQEMEGGLRALGTSISSEELSRTLLTRALATYELLWTTCTRSEKLVLIQLAQEGFINPKCREIAAGLVAKGLIVERPAPMVFNQSFRLFLLQIERKSVINEWERMEGRGVWVSVGRLVGTSMVVGGVFFLVTQESSQSLLPIISGTGIFGIPLVRDLFARVTGKLGATT